MWSGFRLVEGVCLTAWLEKGLSTSILVGFKAKESQRVRCLGQIEIRGGSDLMQEECGLGISRLPCCWELLCFRTRKVDGLLNLMVEWRAS